MYYYLRGTLTVLQPDFAVLDCGGVGYRLAIPASTFSSLSPKLQREALLYTHLAVREDAMDLYGFATEEELDLFRKLISVSGVGPKVASAILGVLTPAELASACLNGDYKSVARAPGVGAKTAQRIVLELKDRLAPGMQGANGASAAAPGDSGKVSQIMDTLLLYGFTREQIQGAMRGLDMTQPLEALITETLRNLAAHQ
ncbi:MAG: Holliday junction branch migration protein RuvA [Oscillospiraceae bacterium]|nr:Holliday junction branch migration protein RuvA [Oscillospiraceae bacterium]